MTLRHWGSSESLKRSKTTTCWGSRPGLWCGDVSRLTFSPLMPVGPTGPGGPCVIKKTKCVMPSTCPGHAEALSRPVSPQRWAVPPSLSLPGAVALPSTLTELPAGPASPKSP